MKEISMGGRERSVLRHFHRRILPAGLLVAFLLAAVLMVAVQVSANDEKSGLTWQQLAQETDGYWVLVETIEDPVRDEQKRVDTIRSDVVCATETNSLSEGSYTHQKEWYQSESFFPCEHNKFSNFAAVATWDRPPERITPGMTLSLEADIIITANDPGHWGSSLTLGITTDAPHTGCGSLTGGAKDVCRLTVSSHQPDKKQDCVLEVGAGRSAGEQFALRYCMGARSCGYRYVYEWVAAEETPAEPSPTPEPTATEEPEVLVNVGGDIMVLDPIAFLSSSPGDFSTHLPLADVKVYLLHGGDEIDQTYSSLDGLFGFWDITETEDLVIKVELAHGIHPPGGRPYFQVVYDQQTDPISFSTQPFEIDPEESEWEFISIRVDSMHELDMSPTQLATNQLIDAALTYYYLRSSWHFAALRLGQTLDLPVITKIYSSETLPAFWYGDYMLKAGPWSNPKGVYISMNPDNSNFRLFDRKSVVMHEFGHHIMADTFDNHMPRVLVEQPHGGFSNPSTTDSWVEGFATFYAAWVQRDQLDKAAPHIVDFSDRNEKLVVNLEENKLAWSQGSGEEFAVAALLWDLIDPIDKSDCTVFPVFNYTIQPYITPDPDQAYTYYCDYVQLTNDQLWDILTGNGYFFEPSNSPNSPENYDYIFDVKDLYRNLKANYWYYAVENGLPERTPNDLDPIDELFIAHGFFADVNPQNLAFDPDEAIGMTSHEALEFGYRIGNHLIVNKSFPARPERRSPPPPPESYIGYQLYDTKSGSNLTPEVGDFFLVEVFYDPPFELYNYSFETRAGSAGKLLYYGPAEHYAATIRVSAVGLDREPANVLEFSNEFYWREGYGKGEEPFIEHVFEVQQQRRGSDSGWVLPAVLTSTGTLCCAGLIIILGVVIVIVVQRRRNKNSR